MSKKKRHDVEDTPLTLDILNDPEKLKSFLGGYVEKGTRKRAEKSDRKAEETVQSFMTELENSAKELDQPTEDPVVDAQDTIESEASKNNVHVEESSFTDKVLTSPDLDMEKTLEKVEKGVIGSFSYDGVEENDLAKSSTEHEVEVSFTAKPIIGAISDEVADNMVDQLLMCQAEDELPADTIPEPGKFEIQNGRIWVRDIFMGSRTFPLDCDEELFHGHLDPEVLGEFAHLVLKHIVINSFPDLITTKGDCKVFEEEGIARANGQRILVKYTLFNSDQDLVLGFNLTDKVIDSYSQMLEDLISLCIDDEEIVNILINMVISYSENNFMSQTTDAEWRSFRMIDDYTGIDAFESALIDSNKEPDDAVDFGEDIYISSSYFEERISEILGIDIDEERGVDHDHDPFLDTNAAATSESTGDETTDGGEESSGSSDEVKEETQEEKEEESDDDVSEEELEAAFQELKEGE